LKVAVNVQCDLAVDEKVLKKACLKAMRAEGARRDAVLSLSAVDRKYIQELNFQYLGIKEPTDVMAFRMNEDSAEGFLLGDVIICPEVIEQNKEQYAVREGREIEFVAVHGVLHLLGYEDDSTEGMMRMDRRQRKILGLREGEAP